MPEPAPAYEVRFLEDARRDVQRLDGSVKKRMRKSIETKLQTSPSDYGKPLSGKLAGYWSYAFGSHRIIYRIYDDRKLVVVCVVGPRREGHQSDVYHAFEALVGAGKTAKQLLEILGPAKGREKP